MNVRLGTPEWRWFRAPSGSVLHAHRTGGPPALLARYATACGKSLEETTLLGFARGQCARCVAVVTRAAPNPSVAPDVTQPEED